jgi:hypothetical protein
MRKNIKNTHFRKFIFAVKFCHPSINIPDKGNHNTPSVLSKFLSKAKLIKIINSETKNHFLFRTE